MATPLIVVKYEEINTFDSDPRFISVGLIHGGGEEREVLS